MKKLTSIQAKFLRGQAHGLKPVVFVGQKGVTPALIASADEAFQRHELIKVKLLQLTSGDNCCSKIQALNDNCGN